MVDHGRAQGGHHVGAQDDVLLHRRVAQVQIAVLQTGGLVGLPAAVDLEGQLVVAAAAQDGDGGGHHLDVAGGELGILAVPLPHDAGDLDGRLLVQGFDQAHHLLGLNDHLSGAVEIPENHEGEVLAHLPDVFKKTGQGDGLAHMLQTEFPTGVGAGLHHEKSTPICIF